MITSFRRVEFGLLTVIAIRGRPVKGHSLADHITPDAARSCTLAAIDVMAMLPPSVACRREVLVHVVHHAHADECARDTWE